MNDLFKLALDFSFDGVLITDAEGVIVYVNPQYQEITGLTSSDVLGVHLKVLLEKGIINRAISLEVLELGRTLSTIHKYSSGKSALSSAQLIKNNNGSVIGVINNTRNIDELLNLREKLRDIQYMDTKKKEELNHLKQIINDPSDFMFVSSNMEDVKSLADKVAKFDTTVVIYGESGTGKEVLSRYIHNNSNRKDDTFIKVNCAAIPKELFESEIFGYEKGAFTGALDKGKIGLFELAHGGTLFLDEIGDLALDAQSKILRAIQEKEIMRIGGKNPIKLNVRLIAATNRDLLTQVEKGEFREDLYFRLNIFPIVIPPLRNRKSDIPVLINYFMKKLNSKYKSHKSISDSALEILEGYDFPGNVRELENIIEYLYIMCDELIEVETIPGKVLAKVMIANHKSSPNFIKAGLPYIVELYEKSVIEDTIRHYHTLEDASKVLGIHYSTLSRKMQKYNLHFN